MFFKMNRRLSCDSKSSTEDADTRFSNMAVVRGEQDVSCGVGYSGRYYQGCSLGGRKADRYSRWRGAFLGTRCHDAYRWGLYQTLVRTWTE